MEGSLLHCQRNTDNSYIGFLTLAAKIYTPHDMCPFIRYLILYVITEEKGNIKSKED